VFFSNGTLPWQLIRFGLLAPDDLLSGHLQINSLSGRHRSFRIRLGPSRGLFCKQARSQAPEFVEALAREARFLRRVALDDAWTKLRRLVPRRIHFEPRRHLLVTDLLPGLDYHVCCQQASLTNDSSRHMTLAASVGHALAEFHDGARVAANSRCPDEFSQALPPAISLDTADSTFFQHLSPANVQLVAELRRDGDLFDSLQANRPQWRAETIIHGDLKWSNLLCDEESAPPEIRFVDWELVSWGDPAWDLAGALHSFVIHNAYEVCGSNSTKASHSSHPNSQASSPQVMSQLWRAYEQTTCQTDIDELRGRVVRFTAARLIQSVMEREYQSPRIDSLSRTLIERSRQLLLDPRQSAPILLGIDP